MEMLFIGLGKRKKFALSVRSDMRELYKYVGKCMNYPKRGAKLIGYPINYDDLRENWDVCGKWNFETKLVFRYYDLFEMILGRNKLQWYI